MDKTCAIAFLYTLYITFKVAYPTLMSIPSPPLSLVTLSFFFQKEHILPLVFIKVITTTFKIFFPPTHLYKTMVWGKQSMYSKVEKTSQLFCNLCTPKQSENYSVDTFQAIPLTTIKSSCLQRQTFAVHTTHVELLAGRLKEEFGISEEPKYMFCTDWYSIVGLDGIRVALKGVLIVFKGS